MERAQEIIVDASVAVKWFSEEEGSERALALRDEHVDGEMTLVAPDLLVYEIENALRFKPGFTPSATAKALDDLFGLQIDFMAPSSEVVRRGAELAFEYGITAYDSCYLSLGEALGTEVVTADGRLHERAKGCGFLRFL
ncbi:MAG: type II toxin-antitoxin system VapC family toxin [Nitrososphaerota archaeon]|nr:type II toxin-antitoxin system VapC family toxin [Nitrososphaerota archaeon]MDG6940247.1 type II toxin-antitoxin system VapC family toxin [Nitrososphaerota archaeon]